MISQYIIINFWITSSPGHFQLGNPSKAPSSLVSEFQEECAVQGDEHDDNGVDDGDADDDGDAEPGYSTDVSPKSDALSRSVCLSHLLGLLLVELILSQSVLSELVSWTTFV